MEVFCVNKLISRMLANRGYDEDFLAGIDRCGHSLPLHVDEMCARLRVHRDEGNQIVLLTDFDMDGISSGVIGFAGLAEMGFDVALYMPSTEGYGFDSSDIDRIREQYPNAKVIMTGDVGVTAFDGVDRAVELGFEVLVTDHHKPAGTAISSSHVCVDPICDQVMGTNPDCFFGSCGAHVMYLVLRRYAEAYSGNAAELVPQIDRLRVFAGIGTVSDSMPVFNENRALIRDAIAICRMVYSNGNESVADMIPGCDTYRRAFLGLFVMCDMFQKRGKIRDGFGIDEQFFGFYVAPAFNSLKRMHGNIMDAYSVFFCGEPLAREAMSRILDLTDERKVLVAEAKDAIAASSELGLQPWAPYVYLTESRGGIRGLLAQGVMSVTGEPAFVVGYGPDGSLSGSGRSPDWFPFIDLCAGLDGVHPSGHNFAFGISFDGPDACARLVEFLRAKIPEVVPPAEELVEKPDFIISTVDPAADTDIDISLFEDFLAEIEMYHPFGSGFPAPNVRLDFRPSEAEWRYIGKDKTHLKAILPHGLTLLCFNEAYKLPDPGSGVPSLDGAPGVISVKGKLSLNDYNGTQTVQFIGHMDDTMDLSLRVSGSEVEDRVPTAAVL